MLQVGGMTIMADFPFEFLVSNYSAEALTVAEHTDELIEAEDLCVRIDYKVSGLAFTSSASSSANKFTFSVFRFNTTYCMGLKVIHCFGNTAKRNACCNTAE